MEREPMMYKKQRVEALSDGIFAIVMTLLVLELKMPEFARGHFGQALAHEWLPFACFCITFRIAARYWMVQHEVFDLAEHFGQPAVAMTFLFLGLVCLLPFTTGLIGNYGGQERGALTIYCAHQALIWGALLGKLQYVLRAHGHSLSAHLRHLRMRLILICATMILAALCTWFVPLHYAFVAPGAAWLVGRTILKERRKKAV